MNWVLKNSNGKYVSKDGSVNSFTLAVKNMKKYPTKEVAENDACGNEWPERIENVID